MKYTSCAFIDINVQLFDNLTVEESELLKKNIMSVSYKKGETVCKVGTLAPHIFYIKEGLAKAYIEGCSETLVLKIVPPGNFIALSSISEGNKVFPYSVKTYTDTEVFLIDIEVMRHLIKQNVRFSNDVINLISYSYQQIIARFFCLTHKQLYGRLADILICLSEKIFKSESFRFSFTRQELGELAKMSPESVIRMLKKFKDDGIIEMNGKNLLINDFDSLRRISDFG